MHAVFEARAWQIQSLWDTVSGGKDALARKQAQISFYEWQATNRPATNRTTQTIKIAKSILGRFPKMMRAREKTRRELRFRSHEIRGRK